MADQILWTPANGSDPIDLTDEAAGYSVEAEGTRGLRSVEYRFTSSTYAGQDGETVNAVTAAANRPTLGLLIQADGDAALRTRLRRLVRAMRPAAGPGVLTVVTPEGDRRHLTCYVEAGLEGDESDDTHLPGRWWKVALKLYAPDPWWEGDEQTLTVGLQVPVPFFPTPPFTLSPSTVQGQFEVDLRDADAPSFPVWTVSGPGTTLILQNLTTGRTIEINTTLTAGQSLIVDTRPGYQSVRRNNGTNLMSAVASDPALWPLIDDLNVVSALLTGSTAASRITATYRPRYAGV